MNHDVADHTTIEYISKVLCSYHMRHFMYTTNYCRDL